MNAQPDRPGPPRLGTVERDCSTLDQVILQSVSRDYTPFESILASDLILNEFDRDTIESRILALHAAELVQGFLLHAEPPFVTRVPIARSTMQQCWFAITEAGESYLEGVTRESIAARQGANAEQTNPWRPPGEPFSHSWRPFSAEFTPGPECARAMAFHPGFWAASPPRQRCGH